MGVTGMYLVGVSVCLGVLYLLYVTLFQSTTFFKANRYYLLGGLFFSFAVPALDLPIPGVDFRIFGKDHIATTFQSQEHDFMLLGPIAMSGETTQYTPVVPVVYYAGVLLMLLRIGYSIRKVQQLKNQSERSSSGNLRIYRTDLTHPFSFFNFIFLPKHEISPAILEHEKVHVSQFHMIDLIIVEMATALLWFNPLVFFYRRSVKAQHEYLADAYTVRNGVAVEDYLQVLFQQIQVENSIGAISHFYSKSIKNRIKMITKNKTSVKFSVVYLLLIPVVCVLLLAFSGKSPGVLSIDQNGAVDPVGLTIIVDPAHGGSDTGAESAWGMTEKDLTLSIARKMQQIGKKNGVNVILTRSDDEALTLEQRTSVSEKFPAKMFISIHLNNDKGDNGRSGIECYISKDNVGFEQSKTFTDHLLNELKNLSGIGVNGIMNSDFYVLKKNTIPAVILELGYLSNKGDYTFVTKDENQRLLAERIIAASLKQLK